MEWGQEKQKQSYRFLQPGMKLTLSSVSESHIKGVAVTLLGYKVDEFIVVDTSGLTSAVQQQINDDEFVVRGLSDTSFGHVIAFRCRALSSSELPCSHLFLSSPTEFVSKPIREHSRYKLSMPCTVSYGQSSIEGKIVDFSLAGCGVYLEQAHDFCKGLDVKVESALNQFLPAGMVCEVVTVRKQGRGSLLGIQFNQQVLMSNRLKTTLAELSLAVS
ncbi:hypothetical protein JCM19240_1814 [Vibrio maritimus]|uniref:PilZ domain-containing protein n=1 Tax=Vibrio maritimus TaxID=990268 RepID=A0A090T8S1_9VIBR|nr:hypothetical protein JCM19240_1814 [Vibrio maritimus]